MVGENENLLELAHQLLLTYSLEELLEKSDIEPVEAVMLMLEEGWIDPEIEHVV